MRPRKNATLLQHLLYTYLTVERIRKSPEIHGSGGLSPRFQQLWAWA